jgi:hypothetical protein
MSKDEGKTYPMMPINSWWVLRKKFVTKIPSEVSATYLASALSTSEAAASANVLPSLRRLGIIDDSGKTMPLATEWRDDAKYPNICASILKKVYPQEIRDLAPDKDASIEQVRSWFANHTSSGESAARKMASFYMMLLEANPERMDSTKVRTNNETGVSGKQTRLSSHPKPGARIKASGSEGGPTIHLNIQIHISPESSAEQIDKIFASIAKHLSNL